MWNFYPSINHSIKNLFLVQSCSRTIPVKGGATLWTGCQSIEMFFISFFLSLLQKFQKLSSMKFHPPWWHEGALMHITLVTCTSGRAPSTLNNIYKITTKYAAIQVIQVIFRQYSAYFAKTIQNHILPTLQQWGSVKIKVLNWFGWLFSENNWSKVTQEIQQRTVMKLIISRKLVRGKKKSFSR